MAGVSAVRTAATASSSDRSRERADEESAASRFASATVSAARAWSARSAAVRWNPIATTADHQRHDEGRGQDAASRRIRRRPADSASARARASTSSACACATPASTNARSTSVGPESGSAAHSAAASSRVPRYSSSSGRPCAVPLDRGRGQVAAYGPADRIVGQPRRQPGPRREQRLVGHLEVVAVAGEQPTCDQGLDDLLGHGRVGADERELGGRQLPGTQRPLLVLLGEPHQDPAGQLLPGLVGSDANAVSAERPTAPVTPPVAR